MPQVLIWLKFLACLAIIFFAGTKLVRYGDAIAEKTGLGRIWIGLVLLAIITSVPELITSVSAVALVGLPDLALGTLFGSCLFNLTILALLDILHRHTPVLSQARRRHIASAGIGVLLIAIAGGNIYVGGKLDGLSLGWVSIPTIIILVLYLVSMWRIYRFERGYPGQRLEGASPRYAAIPARTVYLRFTLAAIAVVGAGIWLSFVGDEIAAAYPWSASFVGSLFLAITTSMPELIVAIAAFRLGAIDMAVADILGANMLDVAHLFIVDFFYAQGPILSVVSGVHLTTAVLVAVMNMLVIIGILFRCKSKTFGVISWYGLALIGLYIFGAYALFKGVGLG